MIAKILKSILAGWIIVLPVSAKMVFQSTLKEVEVKPGEDVVIVSFPFKIVDEDETIEVIELFCTCLGGRVEPLLPDRSPKLSWKVGEEGVIKARFETSKFLGTVEKSVGLRLKNRKDVIPLTVRAKIPELIIIDPSNLKWDKGSEAVEMVAKITINHDKPIKIISHKGRNTEVFPYKLITIREGWEYEIRVTPTDTSKSGMGMISLRTDSELPRFKRAAVYAVVRPKTSIAPVEVK